MFGNVNIGIMGTGRIAGVMAETLRHTKHARLYAVASRDLDRAREFGAKYKAKRAYGSYEQLVQDRRVDLIYVATPNSEHYGNAKLCLDHDKACLVEKPFTVNAAQAQDLFRRAEEHHVLIAEAMWTRYMPFYQKIMEVLSSGVIGAPVMLTASLGFNIRDRKRLQDPALGGGTLLDLGIYPLNFASMVFGDGILRINATCSYTEQHLDEQDSISLVYKDGRMANLSASMLGPMDQQGVITGTKGCMIVENINNFESLTVYDANHRKTAYYKRPKQKTGYEYEVQSCVRALKEKRTEVPEMTHAQTLSMLHMMDFIRQELEIRFPFEAENFLEPVSSDTQVSEEVSSHVEETTRDSVLATEVQEAQAEELARSGAGSEENQTAAPAENGNPAVAADDQIEQKNSAGPEEN